MQDDEEADEELYANQSQISQLSLSPRRGQIAPLLASSQMSLNKPPLMTSSQMSLNSNSTTRRALFQSQQSLTSSPGKKKPVPTPRTILNTSSLSSGNGALDDVCERVIKTFSRLLMDEPVNELLCPICHLPLKEASPCSADDDGTALALIDCMHKLHRTCLKSLMENQVGGGGYIQCPKCQRVYGEKSGSMPECGNMTFKILPKSLPGFDKYHAIQITYNFQNGIQGGHHPMPGQPFFAIGFPKTAFLPDTEKGRRALKLLQIAFNRKLTFEVGVDPSTGQADIVDWNGLIEHKTEFSDQGKGRGYPDEDYLERLFLQLAKLGVAEETEHDVTDV